MSILMVLQLLASFAFVWFGNDSATYKTYSFSEYHYGAGYSSYKNPLPIDSASSSTKKHSIIFSFEGFGKQIATYNVYNDAASYVASKECTTKNWDGAPVNAKQKHCFGLHLDGKCGLMKTHQPQAEGNGGTGRCVGNFPGVPSISVLHAKATNGTTGPEATFNNNIDVMGDEPPTFSNICYIDSFNRYWPGLQNQMLRKATARNSFLFMALRDEFTGTFKAWYVSDSIKYLNGCKTVIDSLIRVAVKSNEQVGNLYAYQDTFYSWLNKRTNRDYMKEVQLYEGYIFSPIMQFLVEAKRRGIDPLWVDSRIRWVQTNIWTKWATRGIRIDGMAKRWHRMENVRTHIGSHFYVMAHAFRFLSDVDSIKSQSDTVISHWDTLLTRNLNPHPSNPLAYIWNSTYDNVAGTHARKDGTRVQDVGHGNHVVDAVVFAHRMGSFVWTRQRLSGFAATAKLLHKNDYTSWDKLDLTADEERPGNWGNFQGGGWIELAEFDPELFSFYRQQIERNNPITLAYNQRWPYRAHLAMILAMQNTGTK